MRPYPGLPTFYFVFQSDVRGNWEKDFYTILVSVIAMISCGTLGPILIPGTVSLIAEFGLDFAQLPQVTTFAGHTSVLSDADSF